MHDPTRQIVGGPRLSGLVGSGAWKRRNPAPPTSGIRYFRNWQNIKKTTKEAVNGND